jgi:hypothetical protein
MTQSSSRPGSLVANVSMPKRSQSNAISRLSARPKRPKLLDDGALQRLVGSAY